MEFMRNQGIHVSQVHRRNDTHSVVSKFSTPLLGVDEFTKEMVCIPVGWWVRKSDREKIVSLIKKFFSDKKLFSKKTCESKDDLCPCE